MWLYLHGWASSPNSDKAQLFLARYGQDRSLVIPDLNQPDFYTLTLTRQIQQIEALLPSGPPVVLIGSSLGALTALWLAQRNPSISQLLLLAPAVQLAANIRRQWGEAAIQQWREQGQALVFHATHGGPVAIGYEFWQDLQRYADDDLRRAVPTLLVHGRDDSTILFDHAWQFAQVRPWIQHITVPSGHALADLPAEVWRVIDQFLLSPPPTANN